MGLDNGILLVIHGKIDEDDDLLRVPGIERADWRKDDQDKNLNYYEICYWRKCWNIRDAILGVVDKSDVPGEYTVSETALRNIRTILENFLHNGENGWSSDSFGSYWSFERMVPQLAWDIVRISALLKYIEDEPNKYFEIVFYDSY